jgi:uncharacterized membrane protein
VSPTVYVLLTTFLASAVEAIEMVTIVVGVGATRGWRATLLGAAAGLAVLVVVVAGFGAALNVIPIGPLRLVIGGLLLVFGLQWYRKGVARVATRGLAGIGETALDEVAEHPEGMDWTAFVLSFKGVLLEGLEVALIVVSFGANAKQLGSAIVGASAAILVIGGAGVAVRRLVMRIPRSLLQLIVGVMLTTFGTFWSIEGMGVEWPGSDAAIPALLAVYALAATGFLALERRSLVAVPPRQAARPSPS